MPSGAYCESFSVMSVMRHARPAAHTLRAAVRSATVTHSVAHNRSIVQRGRHRPHSNGHGGSHCKPPASLSRLRTQQLSRAPHGPEAQQRPRRPQCQLNINSKTVEHLKAWKKRQREEFALLCKEQKRETPVCCSDKGDYIVPENVEQAALLIGNLLSQPPAGKLVEKDPLRMAV